MLISGVPKGRLGLGTHGAIVPLLEGLVASDFPRRVEQRQLSLVLVHLGECREHRFCILALAGIIVLLLMV